MADTLYLLVVRDPGMVPDQLDLCGDGRQFAPGVYCILSELSRSKLYHRIKWQLPEGAGLLVAPLSDAPKFKGMDDGEIAVDDRSMGTEVGRQPETGMATRLAQPSPSAKAAPDFTPKLQRADR